MGGFSGTVRDHGYCLYAGSGCRGPLDAHHIVPRRVLKAHGHREATEDPRNGMCLCRRHHELVERHLLSIQRDCIPRAAELFAAEVGLGWYLDRRYGGPGGLHPDSTARGDEW